MRASSAGLVLNFARLRRANFYRFTQGLHSWVHFYHFSQNQLTFTEPSPYIYYLYSTQHEVFAGTRNMKIEVVQSRRLVRLTQARREPPCACVARPPRRICTTPHGVREINKAHGLRHSAAPAGGGVNVSPSGPGPLAWLSPSLGLSTSCSPCVSNAVASRLLST